MEIGVDLLPGAGRGLVGLDVGGDDGGVGVAGVVVEDGGGGDDDEGGDDAGDHGADEGVELAVLDVADVHALVDDGGLLEEDLPRG